VMTGYFLSLRMTPDGGLMRWISFMAAAGAPRSRRSLRYCCWRTAAGAEQLLRRCRVLKG
jgi:hypothetical protein